MINLSRTPWKLRGVGMIFMLALAGCGPQAAEIAKETSQPTETGINTDTPVPTVTQTPGPTPIPGEQVIPLASMGRDIPWLPMNADKVPMSVYYGFNFLQPPFNYVLVRQAFAAAVDREQIAQEAIHFKFCEVTPATTLTPARILGRDLYNEVGIPFDPAAAQDLLKQAGYESADSFPEVTLVVYTRGEKAPGAYFRMAESVAGMWEMYLGVKVVVEAPGSVPEFLNRLQSGGYDLYTLGWGADYMDPDNYLNTLFHSSSDINHSHYSNRDYDRLVEQASGLADPAERQLLYIQAEQLLTETDTAIIPLFHTLVYRAECLGMDISFADIKLH